jgi:hypothetical protein
MPMTIHDLAPALVPLRRRRSPEGPRPATALRCLHCQLVGRRRLACLQADACRRLPLAMPLGPVLLGAWLATGLAFLISIW